MIGFLFIVVQYNLKVMDFYAWLPSDQYFPIGFGRAGFPHQI